jgi:hypothetical protein
VNVGFTLGKLVGVVVGLYDGKTVGNMLERLLVYKLALQLE